MRRKSPGLNLCERSESPVTNISLVLTALGYIADLVAVTTVTSMLATLVRGLKPRNSYGDNFLDCHLRWKGGEEGNPVPVYRFTGYEVVRHGVGVNGQKYL